MSLRFRIELKLLSLRLRWKIWRAKHARNGTLFSVDDHRPGK